MKETVKIVGFCSKYIGGQGWTTEVPIKYLEQIGYVNLNDMIEQGELVSKDWHDEQVMQAENRIAELENQMCRNEDLHNATEKLNDIIILKQFAERLKEKSVDYYTKGIIDETLKEFINAKHK